MTVSVLVFLLQRVSPKLSLNLGLAWLLWQSFSIPFTILIQDSVWSLNKDWTSILYLPCLLQTFLSETGPNRTLIWVHPFILIPFDFRGNVYSRRKDWFPSPLGDRSEQMNCPTRLISNLLRSIVWITSGLLTISQIVPHIFAICFPVALHWLAILREEVV